MGRRRTLVDDNEEYGGNTPVYNHFHKNGRRGNDHEENSRNAGGEGYRDHDIRNVADDDDDFGGAGVDVHSRLFSGGTRSGSCCNNSLHRLRPARVHSIFVWNDHQQYFHARAGFRQKMSKC